MVPVVAGAASNATNIDEKDTSIPSLSDTPKVTNTTDANNQGAFSQDFKMARHFFSVKSPDLRSSSETK